MSEVVHLERRGDVALITIDSPPVNSLSPPVIEGIFSRIAEANGDSAIRAIVLTGARENFIAGADITGLQAIAEGTGKLDTKGIGALTKQLEEMEANAKPIVMAIDGFALGGGLEVAMAGHWRGWHDALPLRVARADARHYSRRGRYAAFAADRGRAEATEMMLTSVEARGKEAMSLGIIQEMVEPEKLIDAAIAAARKLADGQEKPIRLSQVNDKLGTAAEAKMIMEGAKMIGGDKLRNLIHPRLCMDSILCGVTDGYAAASSAKPKTLPSAWPARRRPD